MESFTNFISTIEFKNYTGIFYSLIFFFFLFGLVWYRTKSTHTIMSRLWKIFHGKTECTDPEIKGILDSRSALMQFRFTTGIPIRLHSHIQPLIQWANKNNEDLDDIAKCGIFFDLENPGLEKTKKITKVLIFLLLLVLSFSFFVMLIFSSFTSTTDKALIKMRGSGNWILINKDTARRIDYFYLVNYKTIKKDDCKDITKIEKTDVSLEKNDIELICKAIKEEDKESVQFIDQTVKEQKNFFPIFVIFFTILNFISIKYILRILRSIDMEIRLNKIRNTFTEDYSI